MFVAVVVFFFLAIETIGVMMITLWPIGFGSFRQSALPSLSFLRYYSSQNDNTGLNKKNSWEDIVINTCVYILVIFIFYTLNTYFVYFFSSPKCTGHLSRQHVVVLCKSIAGWFVPSSPLEVKNTRLQDKLERLKEELQ